MDMITKYYCKKDILKGRKYYNTTDELFIAKERFELVGKNIIPSWLGVKQIAV